MARHVRDGAQVHEMEVLCDHCQCRCVAPSTEAVQQARHRGFDVLCPPCAIIENERAKTDPWVYVAMGAECVPGYIERTPDFASEPGFIRIAEGGALLYRFRRSELEYAMEPN